MKISNKNMYGKDKKSDKTYKSPEHLKSTLKKQKIQSSASNRNNVLKTRKQKHYAQGIRMPSKVFTKKTDNIQKSNFINSTQQQFSLNKTNKNRLFVSAAPSSQFKKYLDDSQNVFYQQSSQFKNLKIIKSAKIYLISLLITLVITYIIIGKIVVFPKQLCPKHADCDVFIHCHKGYILDNEKCIIDPEIIHQAKLISTAVIEQLSYDYGNIECYQTNQINIAIPIQKKMRHVFKQFEIEDEILKEQVINYCMNKQNQMSQHFAYNLGTIIPLQKKYSLSCSVKLFSKTSSFFYLLTSFILAIFLIVFIIRKQILISKAKKIYYILEDKLKQQEFIDILQQKQSLRKVVQWNQQLWTRVDKFRSKQAKIGYYIQQQKLHWRKLP